MREPFLSSDPDAWLRPHWADLHRQPSFANLAPELQAEQLAASLEAAHPSKAREIRDWNRTKRMAMLAGLDQAPRSEGDGAVGMRKGAREVRCVAVCVSCGIDLRLLEHGEIRRTEPFTWAHVLQSRKRQWRTAPLAGHGLVLGDSSPKPGWTVSCPLAVSEVSQKMARKREWGG